MKNFFIGAAVAAFVVLGATQFLKSDKPVNYTPVEKQSFGANPGNEITSPIVFKDRLTYKLISGNQVNSSTTPTTSLSSFASIGHMTIGTGKSFQTASTTAISANSVVKIQFEKTTPVAGVTCNTNIPTSSPMTTVYASTTNSSLNGFIVELVSPPATNPLCFSYMIFN